MFSEQITKYHSVNWMDHKEQHFFKGKQESWYSSIWSFIGCHSLPQNILGKWTLISWLFPKQDSLCSSHNINFNLMFSFLCSFILKIFTSRKCLGLWQIYSHFSVLWTIIALGFPLLNHTHIPAYIFNMQRAKLKQRNKVLNSHQI